MGNDDLYWNQSTVGTLRKAQCHIKYCDIDIVLSYIVQSFLCSMESFLWINTYSLKKKNRRIESCYLLSSTLTLPQVRILGGGHWVMPAAWRVDPVAPRWPAHDPRKRRYGAPWLLPLEGDHHGRRVQLEPHAGLHALQHQPEPLPASSRAHVSERHFPFLASWLLCVSLIDQIDPIDQFSRNRHLAAIWDVQCSRWPGAVVLL